MLRGAGMTPVLRAGKPHVGRYSAAHRNEAVQATGADEGLRA